MPASTRDQAAAQLQAEAWVGDAALELVARRWILQQHGKVDGEQLRQLTENSFLACFGPPTAVEAQIGRLFSSGGIQAVETYFADTILPTFQRQQRRRRSGHR
jgi:dsRNA-specific ribonuclease